MFNYLASGLFISVLRRTLVYEMRSSHEKNLDEQLNSLKQYIKNFTKYPMDMDITPEMKKTLSHFASDFKSRWQKSQRKEDRFLKENENWLNTSIGFAIYCKEPGQKKLGRPTKSFADVCERSKRQKTEIIRASHDSDELVYAAQMSLRSSGLSDAASVLKDITTTSPARASKYSCFVHSPN